MHQLRENLGIFVAVAALLAACVMSAPLMAQDPPALVFESTTVNAGNFAEGDVAEITFPFTNRSNRTVRIARVQTSCGCTASSGNPEQVAPGESSAIRASFNTAGRAGHQTSTITVQTDDPISPNYQLRLALDIVQEVFVAEHLVDFGVLSPGEGGKASFSVITLLDRDLIFDEITSSDTSITVNALGTRPWESDGRRGTEHLFEAVIPEDMKLGDIYFVVNMQTNWRPNPLRQTFRGRVMGDIDFNPKQFFLAIPPGEEHASSITFTSRTTHGFEFTEVRLEGDIQARFEQNTILPRRQTLTAHITAPSTTGTHRATAHVTARMENSDRTFSFEVPINIVVRQMVTRPATQPTRPAPEPSGNGSE